jgi:hypothetical protein
MNLKSMFCLLATMAALLLLTSCSKSPVSPANPGGIHIQSITLRPDTLVFDPTGLASTVGRAVCVASDDTSGYPLTYDWRFMVSPEDTLGNYDPHGPVAMITPGGCCVGYPTPLYCTVTDTKGASVTDSTVVYTVIKQ